MSVDASENVVTPPIAIALEGGLVGTVYEETQYFHPWVYMLVGALTVLEGFVVAGRLANSDASAQEQMFVTGLVATSLCFVVNILVLRTRVDTSELYVRLGWIPLFWTHIPLIAVEDLRVVEYHPIWDAGGWGLRFGRFEGESCRFWNARGNRGVLVVTQKRRYIIGSQQPEALYRALTQMRGTE